MTTTPFSIRLFLLSAIASSAWLLAPASAQAEEASEPLPNAGAEGYAAIARADAGDYKSLNELPPIGYLNPNIPDFKVPRAVGEYREAFVPDTFNVEERARLYVENYLANITVPQLDYEPYDRGAFNLDPPRVFLSTGSYLCALAKFRESLPLARLMTGSTASLAIDEAWAANVLRCAGPDGLNYTPRKGRPWDDAGAYGWLPRDPNVEHYAFLWTGNGRLLGALAVYYEMTGDEIWKDTGRRIVDRLNQLAVTVEDFSFFPRFVFKPGEQVSDAERTSATARAFVHEVGEDGGNTVLWQTWIITGLCQYYRATGYEPARDLARRLLRYQQRSEYLEKWPSHFHCMTLGIQAALEVAEATGDAQYADYARKAYEHAKSGRTMIALPELGYFVNAQGSSQMEGCSVGDMIAIASKLARMGLADWEDVDRYARNMFAEAQFTSPAQIPAFVRTLKAANRSTPAPLKYNHLVDNLASRMIGSWNLHFMTNDLFAATYWDPCCTGNCSRALYYIWENIVAHDPGRQSLDVNLLMNRTSPWLDIDSYIPYAGRVDFHVRRELRQLRVRLDQWIDAAKVAVTVDGRPLASRLEGRRLLLENLRPGTTIRLDFPIEERTVRLASFEHCYAAIFRGNDCVALDPPGESYPLFQRDAYRAGVPRFIQQRRFAAGNAVDH